LRVHQDSARNFEVFNLHFNAMELKTFGSIFPCRCCCKRAWRTI
jgi:hypothetical protein